jgi:uncharacterized membrane protein YeaQ/YmgE (transglycosylase-associated protein family)
LNFQPDAPGRQAHVTHLLMHWFLTFCVSEASYSRRRKMIGILNAESLITKFQIMTLIGFLVLLLIAAICGSIGQSLAGYDLGGCLVSIVVGFIGAYLGLWVAGKFGLPRIFEISIEGKPFPVVWAVIGSALFTLIIGLIRRAFIGRGRY